MTIAIRYVQVHAHVSAEDSTQHILAPDVDGLSCVGAIIASSKATVTDADNPIDNMWFSFGAFDGTTGGSSRMQSDHGAGTANTQSGNYWLTSASGRRVIYLTTGSGSSRWIAYANQFVSNSGGAGVEIVWAARQSSDPPILNCMLFYGDIDFDIRDSFDIPGTSGGTQAVTGVGFEADCVFSVYGGGSSSDTGLSSNVDYGIGMTTNDGAGGIETYGVCVLGDDGDTTSDNRFKISNDGLWERTSVSSTLLQGRPTLGTFTSDGFTITNNDSAAPGSTAYAAIHICVGLNGEGSVKLLDTSTSNGPFTTGFKPGVGMSITGYTTTGGGSYTSSSADLGAAWSFAVGNFDETKQNAHVMFDEDGQSTTDCGCANVPYAFPSWKDDGVEQAQAMLTGRSSTGFDHYPAESSKNYNGFTMVFETTVKDTDWAGSRVLRSPSITHGRAVKGRIFDEVMAPTFDIWAVETFAEGIYEITVPVSLGAGTYVVQWINTSDGSVLDTSTLSWTGKETADDVSGFMVTQDTSVLGRGCVTAVTSGSVFQVSDLPAGITDEGMDNLAVLWLAASQRVEDADKIEVRRVDSYTKSTREITLESSFSGTPQVDDTIIVLISNPVDEAVSASVISSIQAGLATQASVDVIDTNVDAILVDTGTTIPGTITSLQGTADAIETDTQDIQTTLGTPANFMADVSALATQSSVDIVDANVDAILVDTSTTLPGDISSVQATADAIETDTQDIQTTLATPATFQADVSGLATQSSIDTVDANVDAILVDTGTTLPASVSALQGTADAIETDTQDIQTTLGTPATFQADVSGLATQSSVDIIDANVDAIPATIAAVQSTADAIETDTQDLQGRLPAALVGGRIDADVGNVQTDALDADALAADAVAEIQAGLATAADLATSDGKLDSILTDTGTTLPAQITSEVNDVQATIAALNDLSPAEVATSLTAIGLDHLVSSAVTGADVADNSIIGQLAAGDGDWDTFDNATDSLQALRDRGDAAWTTGVGGGSTSPSLLQTTTVATLATQLSFTLTAGSADDDAYNDATLIITDQSTATQKAVARVSNYVGSTKTVTLLEAPSFVIATGDTVDVIAADPAVAMIRKITTNRTVIAGDDLSVDVYADDGTTVDFSFTIDADGRDRTPN